MTVEITFDTSQFREAMQRSPEAIGEGIQTALKDIKNDWKAESIDIAPQKSNTLRENIDGKIIGETIEMRANAVRDGFNYAYYIHEDKGKAVTGEKKFLDVPAQENEDKWKRWLEEEIEKELRKVGW